VSLALIQFPHFAYASTARGTSEPGPFGVIVGDPLVKNVVGAMPGARGYAVQVNTKLLFVNTLAQYPIVPSGIFSGIGLDWRKRRCRQTDRAERRMPRPEVRLSWVLTRRESYESSKRET